MSVQVSETDRMNILKRAFFGLITLAVGLGLLGVRQVTISGQRAAATWARTPCVFERSEFVNGDEGDRFLVLEYRYQVNGKDYTGDRLDMVPGSMGDDGAWERRLHEAHPKGAHGFCYVDPDRPDHSVLDPKHGLRNTANLLLLSTPFLTIAVALLFSVGWSVSHSRAVERTKLTNGSLIPPPPRRVSFGQKMALVQATKQTLVAWAFLVGFVIVFRMLEGPDHFREYFPRSESKVDGEITSVERAPAFEGRQSLYEFSFRYEFADRQHDGASYSTATNFSVGDSVDVIVNPDRPERAWIVGMRRRIVPTWVLAFPVGVIALLLLGIVGSYLASVRSLYLARIGAVAQGELVDAGRSDVQNPVTKHEFVVAGETYRVDLRSALSPTLERCYVLYDPVAPTHNRGLTIEQAELLAGVANPWKSATLSFLPAVVCLAAMTWILCI